MAKNSELFKIQQKVKEKIKELSIKKKASSTKRIDYKKQNIDKKGNLEYQSFFSTSDEDRSFLRNRLRLLHLTANFLRGTPYWRVEGKEKELSEYEFRCFKRTLSGYLPGIEESDIENWIGSEEPNKLKIKDDLINKLYIVIRKDLSRGSSLVQACHVAMKFHKEYSSRKVDIEKYPIVMMAVENEKELIDLKNSLKFNTLWTSFKEPDLNNELTSIAFLRNSITKKITDELKLVNSVIIS
jgi:peptidyl-tRNA hydrolase